MDRKNVEFVLGDHHLSVDTAATSAYYEAHTELVSACSCAHCRNFHAALPLLPVGIRDFLTALGLRADCPAEVMEWTREADGRHWYTVQYQIAGTLLRRGDPVEIVPGTTAAFTSGSGPFLEGFPTPCFQLFLDLRLPWLLKNMENQSL